MSNFVLVHGAFHGAWCWTHLTQELEGRGHRTLAVDLPGSGDDKTPAAQATLELAVDSVVRAIRTFGEPVVLVAHSMGGIVATQVADRVPELISRLVYVAGFRPRNGETLLGLSALPEGAGDGVQANLTLEGSPPVAKFNAAAARDVLFHDCPEDLIEWATPRLKPQPTAIDVTPVSLAAAPFVPTDYVVCTQDHAVPVPLQRFMATRDPARVFDIASSHSPFLSQPRALAEILTT